MWDSRKKNLLLKLLALITIAFIITASFSHFLSTSRFEIGKIEKSSLTAETISKNSFQIVKQNDLNNPHGDEAEQLSLAGLILRDSAELQLLNDGLLNPLKILNPGVQTSLPTYQFFNDKKIRPMILEIKNKISKRIVKSRVTSYTLSTPHRLFDPDWFGNEQTQLELVGVINRTDRWAFSAKTCGELRLVYRLSYRDKSKPFIYSRLPLTMMMSFWQNPADGDCAKLASNWLTLTDTLNAQWYTNALASGSPLRFADLKNIKSIEFNLQAERWPSTMKPSTAGHAEYDLWVFKYNFFSQRFERGKLENTPDVTKLLAEPILLRRFEEFLLRPESLKKLDDGTLVIPDVYLSDSVTSFAFHGSARLSNRPFAKLFSEKKFSKINFKSYKMITSPLAVLTRLNELSCTGCHQTRTIAGFHFLGEDLPLTSSLNSIKSGMSSHLKNDLFRRQVELENWLNGAVFNIPREFSARSIDELGSLGTACSTDYGFSTWTCPKPLFCGFSDLTLNEKIGRCEIAASTRLPSGAACDVGTMSRTTVPNDEVIFGQTKTSCGPMSVCEPSASGFPGGMCTRKCSAKTSDEICGPIALLGPLNTCLTQGKDFDACLRSSVRMSALQSCDLNKMCREDYVCTKVEGESMGACIPPYFLLQLRVDGHPKPTKQIPPRPQ